MIGLAATWAAVALAAADAPPAAMLPAFDATLVSTYPDGRTAKLWLNRDGTFSGLNRKGEPNSGRWTFSRDRLCMKQLKPFFFPISYCTPVPTSAQVSGGWPAKAPSGEPIVVRIVKGR